MRSWNLSDRGNPMILAPVNFKKGRKLYMQAFPADMKEYLSASGEHGSASMLTPIVRLPKESHPV